jgi:hypothetical protein
MFARTARKGWIPMFTVRLFRLPAPAPTDRRRPLSRRL